MAKVFETYIQVSVKKICFLIALVGFADSIVLIPLLLIDKQFMYEEYLKDNAFFQNGSVV